MPRVVTGLAKYLAGRRREDAAISARRHRQMATYGREGFLTGMRRAEDSAADDASARRRKIFLDSRDGEIDARKHTASRE